MLASSGVLTSTDCGMVLKSGMICHHIVSMSVTHIVSLKRTDLGAVPGTAGWIDGQSQIGPVAKPAVSPRRVPVQCIVRSSLGSRAGERQFGLLPEGIGKLGQQWPVQSGLKVIVPDEHGSGVGRPVGVVGEDDHIVRNGAEAVLSGYIEKCTGRYVELHALVRDSGRVASSCRDGVVPGRECTVWSRGVEADGALENVAGHDGIIGEGVAVVADRAATSGLTNDGDTFGVTAKLCNVAAYPFNC